MVSIKSFFFLSTHLIIKFTWKFWIVVPYYLCDSGINDFLNILCCDSIHRAKNINHFAKLSLLQNVHNWRRQQTLDELQSLVFKTIYQHIESIDTTLWQVVEDESFDIVRQELKVLWRSCMIRLSNWTEEHDSQLK